MNRRFLYAVTTIFGLILLGLGLYFVFPPPASKFVSPISFGPTPTPTPLPLLQYTFENLKTYQPQAGPIALEEILTEDNKYTSHLFSFTTGGKRVTGQLNTPQTATPSGGFPIVLMIRGFIEPGIYETGMGTRNAAAYFAQEGFVTVAPDFLGFGGSDNPSPDVFEARLEKPRTVLNLLAAIPQLEFVNPDQLFLWGHSNGGQITLSVLEITGRPIPTTLWAPVSKSFPYSILYYTDQYDDQGKALRQELAYFENYYDVFDFSIDRYWQWIQAPLQIHQGTADPDIPLSWTNQLIEDLETQELDVTYHTYPGADHNLRPAWDTVVARDVAFFRQFAN